jgi:tetratricopeptide (TPR) repeat protein
MTSSHVACLMHLRPRTLCFALLLATSLAPCAYSMDSVARPAPEQEYWAQVERKDWEQAILAAEKLIEAARLNANQAPFELAHSLTLLGNVQIASANYLAAEAAYSEALQILEPRVVPTSDKLLDPLRGMGYTLANAGKDDAAVSYMQRALLVSRRTHGLFNMNQQGILRHLAASFVKLGNVVEAEQQMQYLVRVGEHTYGAKDPRMAGVWGILGDFYMQTGLITPAREAYRRALEVVEKKLGRSDLATVEPLRAVADSYRRELFLSHYGIRAASERQVGVADPQPDGKSLNPRYLNGEGERALKRALKTLESHPTQPTTLLFDTLLDLGDWHMIKSEPQEAVPYYQRAIGLLDQLEPRYMSTARAKVSFPVQIYYPVPTAATRNLGLPADSVQERFVHTVFTVAADGSVQDEQVTDENASARQVSDTVNALRSARYRPKFVDGQPVATENVSLRQVFKLRRERDTE